MPFYVVLHYTFSAYRAKVSKGVLGFDKNNCRANVVLLHVSPAVCMLVACVFVTEP